MGVSLSKGYPGTTRGKEKILVALVGIEPTTSGLDLPLLSYFATWVGIGNQGGDANLAVNASTNAACATRASPKCPLCKSKHVLARCRDFKRLSVH